MYIIQINLKPSGQTIYLHAADFSSSFPSGLNRILAKKTQSESGHLRPHEYYVQWTPPTAPILCTMSRAGYRKVDFTNFPALGASVKVECLQWQCTSLKRCPNVARQNDRWIHSAWNAKYSVLAYLRHVTSRQIMTRSEVRQPIDKAPQDLFP